VTDTDDTTDGRRTTRRTALRRLAAATTVASLAGCAGGSGGADGADGSGDSGGSGGSADGGGETATEPPTATRTPTATATDTPAETATPGGGTPGNATERGDYTVGMYTELYFDPVALYVEPGETVSFELVSGAHSATAYDPANPNALNRRVPEGAPAWNTGTFGDVGEFRNVTFETVGTHDYYCIPHKMVGMVGRIVVGSPGGPAEASENPDLPLPDAERIVDEGAVAWADWEGNV
jgi:plastocyanin